MLLGRQVFKNYGWETGAKATPIVLLVTGVRLEIIAWHEKTICEEVGNRCDTSVHRNAYVVGELPLCSLSMHGNVVLLHAARRCKISPTSQVSTLFANVLTC